MRHWHFCCALEFLHLLGYPELIPASSRAWWSHVDISGQTRPWGCCVSHVYKRRCDGAPGQDTSRGLKSTRERYYGYMRARWWNQSDERVLCQTAKKLIIDLRAHIWRVSAEKLKIKMAKTLRNEPDLGRPWPLSQSFPCR